jgi:hypothetical protein
VFAVGNALHPPEHTDAAYQAATWEAAHLVILASIPLLVLGMPVAHRMLRGRAALPLGHDRAEHPARHRHRAVS